MNQNQTESSTGKKSFRLDKKYFSISEVSKILDIPPHRLKYLEQTKAGFEVIHIKGRRYYTANDIELLRERLHIPHPTIADSMDINNTKPRQYNLFAINNPKSNNYCDTDIVNKIDSLISKFTELML